MASKMVQKEEFADEDAVEVTRMIAFFANAGEKGGDTCTKPVTDGTVSAEAVGAEAGATESGKKSIPSLGSLEAVAVESTTVSP